MALVERPAIHEIVFQTYQDIYDRAVIDILCRANCKYSTTIERDSGKPLKCWRCQTKVESDFATGAKRAIRRSILG